MFSFSQSDHGALTDMNCIGRRDLDRWQAAVLPGALGEGVYAYARVSRPLDGVGQDLEVMSVEQNMAEKETDKEIDTSASEHRCK